MKWVYFFMIYKHGPESDSMRSAHGISEESLSHCNKARFLIWHESNKWLNITQPIISWYPTIKNNNNYEHILEKNSVKICSLSPRIVGDWSLVVAKHDKNRRAQKTKYMCLEGALSFSHLCPSQKCSSQLGPNRERWGGGGARAP
jgi:hypothetical protein